MLDLTHRPHIGPDGLISVLDIGTSKVCCLIGRTNADGLVQVLGLGLRACRGLQAGMVTDMDAAERAIRAAVDQAEKLAGVSIGPTLVSANPPALASDIVEVAIKLRDRRVTQSAVDQLASEALRAIPQTGQPVLHAFPAAYVLDGTFSVKPPINLFGEKLGLALHVIRGPEDPLRNLKTCVQRAHVSVSGLVAAGYAAGQAALVTDERDLGSACIDIGAAVTTLSMWTQGTLVHLESLDWGGECLTKAIARQLQTPLKAAERLKVLEGAALPELSSPRERIPVPDLDGQPGTLRQLPRQALIEAMEPALERLFLDIGRRLEAAGLDEEASGRVVLTGGAAQLQGLADFAQAVLNRPVRIGRPRRVLGLAQAAQTPAFAAAAGLLLHAVEAPLDVAGTARPTVRAVAGGRRPFKAIAQWLNDHF